MCTPGAHPTPRNTPLSRDVRVQRGRERPVLTEFLLAGARVPLVESALRLNVDSPDSRAHAPLRWPARGRQASVKTVSLRYGFRQDDHSGEPTTLHSGDARPGLHRARHRVLRLATVFIAGCDRIVGNRDAADREWMPRTSSGSFSRWPSLHAWCMHYLPPEKLRMNVLLEGAMTMIFSLEPRSASPCSFSS